MDLPLIKDSSRTRWQFCGRFSFRTLSHLEYLPRYSYNNRKIHRIKIDESLMCVCGGMTVIVLQYSWSYWILKNFIKLFYILEFCRSCLRFGIFPLGINIFSFFLSFFLNSSCGEGICPVKPFLVPQSLYETWFLFQKILNVSLSVHILALTLYIQRGWLRWN